MFITLTQLLQTQVPYIKVPLTINVSLISVVTPRIRYERDPKSLGYKIDAGCSIVMAGGGGEDAILWVQESFVEVIRLIENSGVVVRAEPDLFAIDQPKYSTPEGV